MKGGKRKDELVFNRYYCVLMVDKIYQREDNKKAEKEADKVRKEKKRFLRI
jgi:hypothetical protein